MSYPLLFATHNAHKVEEIKKFAPSEFHISSLADKGWTTPIEETGQTLEANAWIKTHTLVNAWKGNCFASCS
ncbi:MAG: non-canonical purine NTP pyrophosphatase, partial [Flavobacteriaceae bacterium]